jgi:hypothetical protein
VPGVKGRADRDKVQTGTSQENRIEHETEQKSEQDGTSQENGIEHETEQESEQDGTSEDLHAIPVDEPEPLQSEPFQPPDVNIEDDCWGDTSRHNDETAARGGKKGRGGSKGAMADPAKAHGKPHWPPRETHGDFHAGYDLACKWIEEVRVLDPKFPLATPTGPQVATAHKIMQAVDGHETALAIVRLALWDWPPIQETIETWYTKGKPVPEPQHIFKLLPHLASKVGRGIISPAHRCSAYCQRWIDGTWKDPNRKTIPGTSLAAKARRQRGLVG